MIADPDDPRPTLAQLQREDADPPDEPLRRNGHLTVARYVQPPEPIVHLASDGVTTLCGEVWELRVVRTPHPTCSECVKEAGDE